MLATNPPCGSAACKRPPGSLAVVGFNVNPSRNHWGDMQMNLQLVSLPDDPTSLRTRRQLLVDFWSELRIEDPAGATRWEVSELERGVTECLAVEPLNRTHEAFLIARAETLTAQALFVLAKY
jgi:hypothetical protein